MALFDFTHAILRAPGRSAVHGLRSDAGAVPDYRALLAEHAAYVAALGDAGLTLEVLPPLEEFPDSMFVEDPALVFSQGAILLRPGAQSRRGEREPMRAVLQRHFPRVLDLADGTCADGGDVLATPDGIFIGLSARTGRAGAESLVACLAELGHHARIAETPAGVLHFKTAISLLDEETVLATPAMARSGIFAGFRIIAVPEGEEAAANALRIHGRVLIGSQFPRTRDLLEDRGYPTLPLPLRETAKLDAGLSCMSLRWRR